MYCDSEDIYFDIFCVKVSFNMPDSAVYVYYSNNVVTMCYGNINQSLQCVCSWYMVHLVGGFPMYFLVHHVHVCTTHFKDNVLSSFTLS